MILPLREQSGNLGDSVSQGGVVSNTPPQNNRKVSGGVDTAVFGLEVDWGMEGLSFLSALSSAQEASRSSHTEELFQFGGLSAVISPSGYSTGGSKGMYLSYLLKVGDLKFGLASTLTPTGSAPNVMLHIGSMVLVEYGSLRAVYDAAMVMIGQWGGMVLGCKMSRVDICVDIEKLEVGVLCASMANENVVSRARHEAYYRYNRKASGLVLGKGAVMFRAYDKRLETEHNPEKWNQLLAKRLDDGAETCTRAEFQLRREFLKKFSIDTIDDFEMFLPALAKYLTSEWCRFCFPFADGHSSTADILPEWKQIEDAFTAWIGDDLVALERCAKSMVSNLEGLENQAFGCLLRCVAERSDGEILDKHELLKEMVRCMVVVVDRADEDLSLGDRQQEKLLDYYSRAPVSGWFVD